MSTSPLPRAEDTIAAIATAPGRGAIALVRMSGPDATRIARSVITDFDANLVRVVRLASVHHPAEGTLIDRALVTLFRAPQSYTGEDVVEISVHGGAVVPALVLSALITAGARQALPGEFTRRAVANGRMDLLQAEAVADLVDARSRMAHRIALAQLDGGLSHRTAELRDAILNLEALIAYDIDFPEEDEGTVDQIRVTDGVTRALSALETAGARQALPGEFTHRAVANGRMDLLQAEAVADLVDARSRMAHRTALAQLDGGLSHRTAELRDAILNLEALIAYDIDFPEEDEGTIDQIHVTDGVTRALTALEELLSTGDTGEMLREGALVVIGGAPNAGKSSLFNALVGRQRAIVTDVPGTTRDAIEAVVEIQGWPVRLVDTAGLRESTDVVERLGIEVSERYLADADIVLLCAEALEELQVLSHRVDSLVLAPWLAIRTKADLAGLPHLADEGEVLTVSALTGQGLEHLTERIASVLSERFGAAVDEAPLLTRDRHRQAVGAARTEMLAFREAWARNEPPASVAAIHLREAAHHLTELIGSVDVEEVLGRVFSTFCVGK